VCFDFLYNFDEIFSVLRRTERDIIVNINRASSLLSSPPLSSLLYSGKKLLNTKCVF
jgi:hypothetical protein